MFKNLKTLQDPSFEQSFIQQYRQQVSTAAGVPLSAVAVTGIQSSGVLVQTQVTLTIHFLAHFCNISGVLVPVLYVTLQWAESHFSRLCLRAASYRCCCCHCAQPNQLRRKRIESRLCSLQYCHAYQTYVQSIIQIIHITFLATTWTYAGRKRNMTTMR